MARTSTYLNFSRSTEEAFGFYKSVFQTDYLGPIHRFDSVPPNPEQPLADADKNLVMHVELPILGGHVLMGTDAPESMGFNCKPGNNIYINLEPDTRRKPTGSSMRCPRAARSRCQCRTCSGARISDRSPIALASSGWSIASRPPELSGVQEAVLHGVLRRQLQQ